MKSLKQLLCFLIFVPCLGVVSHSLKASEQLPMPEVNEDGVYTQTWFLESFLDLREDLLESRANGKHLAILWEQRGCPYCKETHAVNLRVPKIVNYIKNNFNIIQLNLWGDKEVTDFDGEVTTEKKLARKYKIQFTPTMQFFAKDKKLDPKKSGAQQEIWRIMGYWKPFHFLNTFVYVRDKGYIKQPNFQRWLQAHAEEMRSKGVEVKLW